MRTASYLILITLIVLMGAVLFFAFRFEYQQAKLAPLTISGLILVLAAIELVREVGFLWRWEGSQKGETENKETPPIFGRYLVEGAWMAGFVLATYLLGFLIAIPLFGILYMKSHGTGWLPSITVSVLLLVFIFVIFSLILDFRFDPGILFTG